MSLTTTLWSCRATTTNDPFPWLQPKAIECGVLLISANSFLGRVWLSTIQSDDMFVVYVDGVATKTFPFPG